MAEADSSISTEEGPSLSRGHQSHTVRRYGRGLNGIIETDDLASEIPVALEYNGISHATLLATPENLEDLAYGFSYTEGVIRTAQDIYDVQIEVKPQGMVVQIEIASACLHALKRRRRSLAGRTGCGLCGIESLDEVRRILPVLTPRRGAYSAQAISRAVEQLRSRQPLHLSTGATHAAAWADSTGCLMHVREDVGRHNALDKLIGHGLRAAINMGSGMTIVSSRASFEMVQKTAAAGVPALIAVSAPTTYAVALADELNLMLAGFARNDQFTVYSHPDFLLDPGSEP